MCIIKWVKNLVQNQATTHGSHVNSNKEHTHKKCKNQREFKQLLNVHRITYVAHHGLKGRAWGVRKEQINPGALGI